MIEIINYPKYDCGFCGKELACIQPIDELEAYYHCTCKEWQKNNPKHSDLIK